MDSAEGGNNEDDRLKSNVDGPQWPIGTCISNFFEDHDDYFNGYVAGYDTKTGFYRIVYDDGDSEEFDLNEMKKHVLGQME